MNACQNDLRWPAPKPSKPVSESHAVDRKLAVTVPTTDPSCAAQVARWPVNLASMFNALPPASISNTTTQTPSHESLASAGWLQRPKADAD